MQPRAGRAWTCLVVALAVGVAGQRALADLEGNGAPGRLLEADLSSIVQQHAAEEGEPKRLVENLMSRLMKDDFSGARLLPAGGPLDDEVLIGSESSDLDAATARYLANLLAPEQQAALQESLVAPDAVRLRKLQNFLENMELVNANQPAFADYPPLPASAANTMKRATAKAIAQQQQQQQQMAASNSQAAAAPAPLGRPNYAARANFGAPASVSAAGARPGAGDALNSVGGHLQPVSQFGKRPNTQHRFDFGLGKRVASPTYPRYDFGLGKRAPHRIRYDFGLGK